MNNIKTKIYDWKKQDKFSIRKLNMGVVSLAIGGALLLQPKDAVAADEVTETFPSTEDQAALSVSQSDPKTTSIAIASPQPVAETAAVIPDTTVPMDTISQPAAEETAAVSEATPQPAADMVVTPDTTEPSVGLSTDPIASSPVDTQSEPVSIASDISKEAATVTAAPETTSNQDFDTTDNKALDLTSSDTAGMRLMTRSSASPTPNLLVVQPTGVVNNNYITLEKVPNGRADNETIKYIQNTANPLLLREYTYKVGASNGLSLADLQLTADAQRLGFTYDKVNGYIRAKILTDVVGGEYAIGLESMQDPSVKKTLVLDFQATQPQGFFVGSLADGRYNSSSQFNSVRDTSPYIGGGHWS